MKHAVPFALLFVLATHDRPAFAQTEQESSGPKREVIESPPVGTDSTSSTRPDVAPPSPRDTAVVYPQGATGEARVVLQLTIDTEGRVVATDVIEGQEPFASAAREQARSWHFSPATRQGKPIAARIRYEVRYVQEKAAPPAPAVAQQSPQSEPAPTAAPTGEPQYKVIIRGQRPESGGTTFSRAEANVLPGAFGDPFRVIESLPGVTPIVSGVPFFYIRGAPPGNVGYFIDGVRVPSLFHGFTLAPVVHPALIERVDLYRGGYPARYGRFAGGVVTADLTEPPARLTGEGFVRSADAGGIIAAPFNEDQAHVRVAGRYSYTALILSIVTKAQLDYWDYQLLADYDISRSDTVSVFGFGAYDFVGDDKGENFLGSEFHRLDVREDHSFGERTKVRTAVTYGVDRSRATNGTIGDRIIGARTEWVHRPSDAATFRFGADVESDHVSLNLIQSDTNLQDFKTLFPARDDLVLGGYTEVELHPESWVTFTPGIRADVYDSAGNRAVGVDPRVSATFDVTNRIRLVHAFGVAHQTPNFIPSLPAARVGGLRGGLQTSLQSSAGVEADGPFDVTGSLTFFQQTMFNLSDPLGFSRALNTNLDTADLRATGYAYGMEVLLQRPLTRRLGGLLAYTLSRSIRSHERLESLSAFDRTHVASLALSYDFGRRWRAGARMGFVSGVPTRHLTVDGPRFTSDRGPPYYRLDLRLEKRWRLSERAWLGLVGEMLNATFSREVIGRSCNSIKCTESVIGPIYLPSIGVEAGF